MSRVVRQAKALQDAGCAVTVISFKRPCAELIATTPGVQYVEVAVDPWTRRYLIDKRRRLAAKRSERAGDSETPRSTLARAIRRPLRYLFIAVPSAVLLRVPGEKLLDRAREIAALPPLGVSQLYLRLLGQHANTLSFAEKACEAMAGRSFDYCQAHDNYALIAAARLAEQSGARLYYDAVEISEHRLGYGPRSLAARLISRYERRQEAKIFKSADEVITIGDGLADWYAKRYRLRRPLPVRNCRYYWEYTACDDIRRDCGVTDGESIVTWFGYAYPDQGLDVIVEAARHVPESVHFALLTAVLPRWEGFFEQLTRRVTELGLERRVHFLPARDPNELISYVSGADAGIIPRPNVSVNVYYSMPNKFMEMVMARLPIAISDLIDMRTLIERHGIGVVFDVEDPEDIARKLTSVLAPENHARLRAAVMDAASELCWENEARRYVELFDVELAAELSPAGAIDRHAAISPSAVG